MSTRQCYSSLEVGALRRPSCIRAMARAGHTEPWYGGSWKTVRVDVLNRDRYRCQIRGPKCTGRATEVDHIISPRHGGAWWEPTNLRAACKTCNLGRNGRKRGRVNGGTYPGPSTAWRE